MSDAIEDECDCDDGTVVRNIGEDRAAVLDCPDCSEDADSNVILCRKCGGEMVKRHTLARCPRCKAIVNIDAPHEPGKEDYDDPRPEDEESYFEKLKCLAESHARTGSEITSLKQPSEVLEVAKKGIKLENQLEEEKECVENIVESWRRLKRQRNDLRIIVDNLEAELEQVRQERDELQEKIEEATDICRQEFNPNDERRVIEEIWAILSNDGGDCDD